MRDHTVHMDRSVFPAKMDFAPVFNASVPFLDRPVQEGLGEKLSLRSVEEDLTYGQLAALVQRCGNHLLALGLEPGQRLLLAVKDSPEFVALFFGAIRAGIVPVPLNTLLRAADYRFLAENSGCSGVAYSPEFAAEVEAALAAAEPRPAHVLRLDPDFRGRLAAHSPALEPARTGPEDDCFWLYSSGSTGRPKGAVHLQRSLAVTSQRYGVETLGVRPEDVCYSAAKLFFAYGLGNALSFPLWAGATAVLSAPRPTPDLTWQTIERFRPTLYFAVPTLYAALLQSLETRKPDLSSLRLCVSAGEALPAGLYHRWKQRTGLDILDGIGSTENLHMFISNQPGQIRPGSSGRPVPGYEAAIVDEAGAPVAPGEQGRLRVRGLSSARGYWNDPERTARTMQDGWLDTGDTYLQDEEGWYVYCGRSDDMLKVSGQWCSPFEIEACLVEHPRVLEAAVVGRADQDGLIKPEAFVVLKDRALAGEALAEELLRHCRDGLAHYKAPRWLRFLDELPKTATGKIQRFRLRQLTPPRPG
jgi:benzoate-CoA ligase family protein